MSINIVLSPSQQYYNKCLEGDTEQDHCYVIAERCAEYLKNYNANVCLIPKFRLPEKEALKKVVSISNDFITKYGGNGFHLDMHTDGGYKGSGPSGFYVSEAGKSFIMQVYKEIVNIAPWGYGTVNKRDLFVLNNTIAVAGLIEISFHDIKEQSKWIHAKTDLIAKAINKSFCNSTGLVQVFNNTHWAEESFQKVVKSGIIVNERRFDEPLTRGEYFVLEAQKIK